MLKIRVKVQPVGPENCYRAFGTPPPELEIDGSPECIETFLDGTGLELSLSSIKEIRFLLNLSCALIDTQDLQALVS